MFSPACLLLVARDSQQGYRQPHKSSLSESRSSFCRSMRNRICCLHQRYKKGSIETHSHLLLFPVHCFSSPPRRLFFSPFSPPSPLHSLIHSPTFKKSYIRIHSPPLLKQKTTQTTITPLSPPILLLHFSLLVLLLPTTLFISFSGLSVHCPLLFSASFQLLSHPHSLLTVFFFFDPSLWLHAPIDIARHITAISTTKT